MKFVSEPICRGAQPGQFVHIRADVQSDPLLPRPFSIHDIDREVMGVEILFQVVGSGTRILSSKRKGESIEVLGPLGRGFGVDHERRISVLVAGGIGLAPFPFLIKRLRESGHSVFVLAGWKTVEEIVGLERIESSGASVDVATEDGRRGSCGTVTKLLNTRLRAGDFGSESEIGLYACGPGAMLATVAHMARQYNVPCQVSLEERMACGVGACYGCAVLAADRENACPEYKLVCKDGPVFDMNEVCLK
ncbi:MAG: dihydroorotate dehydrogenase electron transfer subunit [Gemmatimonadota bacterium]|nr:MAG: dihydroorotate dehydrogenase electron transfer subunit [Gemmatimonadota bacterium]